MADRLFLAVYRNAGQALCWCPTPAAMPNAISALTEFRLWMLHDVPELPPPWREPWASWAGQGRAVRTLTAVADELRADGRLAELQRLLPWLDRDLQIAAADRQEEARSVLHAALAAIRGA